MTLAQKIQGISINVTYSDHNANFHVSGILDEIGAAELKEQFEKLSLTSLKEVIFNFRDVTYIGSAGLGKLLLFYKKLSTENIKMRVECPSDTTRNLMLELKLNSLFTVE